MEASMETRLPITKVTGAIVMTMKMNLVSIHHIGTLLQVRMAFTTARGKERILHAIVSQKI